MCDVGVATGETGTAYNENKLSSAKVGAEKLSFY